MARSPRPDRDRPGPAPALGIAVATLAWTLAITFFQWTTTISTTASLDVGIYREAAQDFLAGADVYIREFGVAAAGGLPFTYPPFALLVFTPLTVPGSGAATAVVFAASSVCLVLCLRWCADYAAPGRRVPWWGVIAAAAPVAVVVEPVRLTLGLGQINLILLALVLGLDARGTRWSGIGAGVGAAIKVTPALLVAAQLARRDLTAFVRGVGAFVACTVLAALVAWPQTLTYFGGLLWESDRPGNLGYAGNQSLRGLVERTAPGAVLVWVALAGATLAVAVLAINRHRRDPWLSLTAAAVAGLLISPVSWTHHWVWALPVVAVGVRWWSRSRVVAVVSLLLGAATAFLAGPATGLDYSWLASIWEPAALNVYVAVAVVWLLVVAASAPAPLATTTAKVRSTAL